jgi:hypothetical protein
MIELRGKRPALGLGELLKAAEGQLSSALTMREFMEEAFHPRLAICGMEMNWGQKNK